MKNIIFGLVSVVAIAGVVYFAYPFKKDTSLQTESKKASIQSLLLLGGSQKCVYSADIQGVTTSATVYISKGNMRADSKVIIQGKDVESHMIVMNDTSYIWGGGLPQGLKLDIKNLTAQNQAKNTQGQPFDMTKEIDYTCSPWTYDASLFALPSGIEFGDMSAMIQKAMPSAASKTNTANMLQAQCGACSSLEEPAKSQCRTALGCK